MKVQFYTLCSGVLVSLQFLSIQHASIAHTKFWGAKNSTNGSEEAIKLPGINLPSFDGFHLGVLTSLVYENKHLCGLQKFCYLRSCQFRY